MQLDQLYQDVQFQSSEIPHRYSKNIHLLSDPALLTVLAQFGAPDTVQPRANALIRILYEQLLLTALNLFAPQKVGTFATRMSSAHPGAKFHGKTLDRSPHFVVMDLMRAGIYPSHICYEMLHVFYSEQQIRQDHIVGARRTDEQGRVVGVDLSGSKIGGKVKNAIVIVPDPMAATGGTVTSILKKYQDEFEGPARDVWLLHLIVTPEYIQKISKEFPDAKVLAIRCDRGMSTPEVLSKGLGDLPQSERGLNSHQYIVPGAGGIGEILNNSFV